MVGLRDGAEEEVGFWCVEGIGGGVGVGLEFGVAPAAGSELLGELCADGLGDVEGELMDCAGVRGLRGVRARGVRDGGCCGEVLLGGVVLLLLLLLWVGVALRLLPLRWSGLLTGRRIRLLSLARIALLLLILLLPVLRGVLSYPILLLITALMPLPWVALLASLLLLIMVLVCIGVVADIEILFDRVELLLGAVDDVAEEWHYGRCRPHRYVFSLLCLWWAPKSTIVSCRKA